MRRSYRDDRPVGPRINDRIRISPIRLIDETGQMIGIVELDEARRRAHDLGLDLVEIAADVRPPVVRIMDFGKFKYEKSKQDKANRSKVTELKEVRLGRSMKIDPHDVGIRLDQARRFLLEGHKVQIVQNFRGREIAHRDRGDDRMEDVIERLSDVGRVEVPPRLNGRRMTMIIGPDRPKIEAIKRREAAEKVAAGGAPAPVKGEGKEKPAPAAGAATPPASPPAAPPAPTSAAESRTSAPETTQPTDA